MGQKHYTPRNFVAWGIITTLSFHLATSAHVISIAVGDPDEMTLEVNTFIMAANSIFDYISLG